MLFQRKRSRRGQVEEANERPFSRAEDESGYVRLAKEAKRVRELLRPFTVEDEQKLPKGYWAGMRPWEMRRNFWPVLIKWWFGSHMEKKLGQIFGPGILCMVAKLDIHGTGTITATEASSLEREANEKAEQIMGYATQQMVISMLTLSIAIPLCVYQLSTVTPDELIATPSLGAGWVDQPQWYAPWMGSAALHVLYWIEAAILAISVMLAAHCILACNFLYMNLSINLPDVESKVYYMVDSIQSIEMTFLNAISCLQMLLMALPLLGCRISPVAGICLIIPTVSLQPPMPIPGFSFWFNNGKGQLARDNMENCHLITPAFHQMRYAKELLRKADGPRPDSVAAPAPPSATVTAVVDATDIAPRIV